MSSDSRASIYVWSATGAHEALLARVQPAALALGRSVAVWNGEADAFRSVSSPLLIAADVDADDADLQQRIAGLDGRQVAVVVLFRAGRTSAWAGLPAVVLALPGDGFITQDALTSLIESATRASSDRVTTRSLRSIVEVIDRLRVDSGDFLHSMVEHLASVLGLECVLMAESQGSSLEFVRTRALWMGGQFIDNITYELAGTPCTDVLSGPRVCVFPGDVARQFPDDPMLEELSMETYIGAPVISPSGELEGLLVGMDTAPRADSQLLGTVIEFFAGRAAVEIARARHDRKLESLNAELEARIEVRTRELKEAQARLLHAAHRAGMADMAVSVMHNVGNMLNAVVTASDAIHGLAETSAFRALSGLTELLGEQDDLATFLTRDERGQRIPELLGMVRDTFDDTLRAMSEESSRIRHAVGLIDKVIKMQHQHTDTEMLVTDTDIEEFLDDLVALHQPQLEEFDVGVDLECEEPVTIRVHRIKLLHMASAIVTNAIEAVRSHARASADFEGRIHIRAETDEYELRIHITDNGVGMDESWLSSIFQPGVTSKEGGLGLGLHGSACAAQELGGHIDVASDGVGHGARFTIHVPRQPV